MKKVFAFFSALLILAVLGVSFYFWWYCLKTTEHTFTEAVVSFVVVAVVNIFFDSFVLAFYGFALSVDKAADKIFDNLFK